MKNALYQKSLISIQDLSLPDLKLLFKLAGHYRDTKESPSNTGLLQHKIIGSTFFEASTRTRLSFEAAAYQLGAQVIGFSDASNTSLAAKGESLKDSLKIIGSYCDLLVLRHPQEGAARLAAEVAGVPVINAGDGANQHPTQTLLDLFTMQTAFPQLEGLNLVLTGDLKHSRTIHSLVQAAHLFKMRLYFVAINELSLPETLLFQLKCQAVQFSFHQNLEEVIKKADVLYMTRVQKERINKAHNLPPLILDKQLLAKAKTRMKILHPLPRREELPTELDNSPHAYYFEQAKNGLYIRKALLSLILHKEVPL